MAGKKSRGRRGSRYNHNHVNNGKRGSRNHNHLNNNKNNHCCNDQDNASESTNAVANVNETPNAETVGKQDEPQIFSAVIKTLTGEKLDVQFGAGDAAFEIRHFLLDSKETCFVTRYDLLLHTNDGRVHQLEDHDVISEVADITKGEFFFEMVPALYDDRTVRIQVRHTQELLSLSNLHASPSVSLAMHNEKEQNKAANSEDTLKSEVPELDGLCYLEDVSGFVANLLPSPLKDVKCVESLVFSSFNPPPAYRRLVGDLLYLDVVTLEGNEFCITGSTRMFYVNSCTANTFDPRPSKATFEATTLVALLQKISPRFKKAFREVLEQKASAIPSENVQSSLLPNSWLGLYPVPDHRRDLVRAENSLTLLYGTEPVGMQREWNEELQSCRELPHKTQQERILRDRALHRITSDFVDAAINGAIGVISGCIPPINANDPECFQMYMHNNIFYSNAVDTDIQQLSKKSSDATNSKTWSTGTLHGSSEKSSDFQVPNGVKNDDSSSEDHINGLEVTQDVPSESQQAECDVATYASVNNDLNGTKAYQEADVPGLYNLAVAVIDYRGRRVLAQSILPGILQGDNSDSLVYGSLDNGKKISFDENFHSKVLEAAKRLHLKEHSVLDRSENVSKLAVAVECKGLVGSDNRHYLLDLVRVTPRDANYTGQGSQYRILRAELIAAFCQAQAAVKSKSKETNSKEADNLVSDSQNVADADELDLVKEKKTEDPIPKELFSASIESFDHHDEIVFNPNVFTKIKLAGSPEEIAADENNVRKVSLYLTDVVIPKFIQDLCTLKVSPMDGRSLTEALHAQGINVRYIGKVADGIRHLPHLWDLCTNEIVVRSSKHLINDVLRDTEDHDLAQAICHLFNCLFGNSQALTGKITSGIQSRTPTKEHSKWKPRRKGREFVRNSQPSYMSVSSQTLWSNIQELAIIKYKFELPEDARSRGKKISVIRNLCLKVGIVIAARTYDLNSATPFQTSDILDLRPVVKHSIPVSLEAKELVEAGKLQFAEDMLGEAYAFFSEAFAILQQVTGPVHREVANCCRYLAMVLYHAGDMAGAITQQQKELTINERCLGLDHPDTAQSYSNLALFYHALNRSELALHYMSRALLLLNLSCGSDHPDIASTFVNIAMMYQEIGNLNIALRYLQEALKKNERVLGEEHIQTALSYHALAIAFNHMGAFKLSYQHEKRTFDILAKQLGEDDSKTREAQNWMNKFKLRELQKNAQKQKDQALNDECTQKAIDILKARPELIHAFQAAAVAGVSGSSSSSSNGSLNSALIETFPRGRGIDERAAHAAAGVRRKAAARGLLRPRGVQVQPLTPLTQLLNIINSGVTPDAMENVVADAVKKEDSNGLPSSDAVKKEDSNSFPSSDATDAKNDHSSKPVEEQAPVGLGKGLTSLDAKKRKSKSKAGA